MNHTVNSEKKWDNTNISLEEPTFPAFLRQFLSAPKQGEYSRSRKWCMMYFPQTSPQKSATSQRSTLRQRQPHSGGYLVHMKEKTLPNTGISLSVRLCEMGSSANTRKLQKITK